MDQGPRVQSANPVVHHALDTWFTFLANHGRSPVTITTYANCLRWFTSWLASTGIPWDGVTRGVIEQWIADMRAAGRHPKSILSRVGAVKGFFSWLFNEERIARNPCAGLAPIKTPQSLPRFYNKSEVGLMIGAARTPREKMAMELFYASGVRRQGMLDIRLQDVDLKSRLIKIRHKGGKERYVVINPSTVLAILRWLPHRAMIARNWEHDEGWLFVGRQGQLSGQRLLDMVHAVARRAGVPLANCRAWRHTFGTHMMNAGMDIKTLKGLMGHESIATTDRYTHLAMDRMKEMYDKSHPRELP